MGRWQEVQPSAVPEVTALRQIIFGIATKWGLVVGQRLEEQPCRY
jgi:hypothetical protein